MANQNGLTCQASQWLRVNNLLAAAKGLTCMRSWAHFNFSPSASFPRLNPPSSDFKS